MCSPAGGMVGISGHARNPCHAMSSQSHSAFLLLSEPSAAGKLQVDCACIAQWLLLDGGKCPYSCS